MLNTGMTPIALAHAVGVDAKSVARWIAEDRMPYPVTRVKVAGALGQEETFLWPALLEDGDACDIAAAEIERVWPARSAITSDTWHALFTKASRELDILVYAGAFLMESLDLADVLTWKASRGAKIRMLVGDPRSAAVQARAVELSLDWLPQRCQSTLDYLHRAPGICLRSHGASHYASIFRFDDLLLANTHAYGEWACHSPVLQLRRASSGRLFDFYRRSFDRVWGEAGCRTDPGAPLSTAPATDSP